MTIRFPPLAAAEMSESQRVLAAQYRSGWRKEWMPGDGRLGGPLDALIRTPEVAIRVSSLSDLFRAQSALPAPVKSLSVLMAARNQRSSFMWAAHVGAALESGLTSETVSSIASGERPGSLGPREAATYDLLTEISRTKQVTDECFERAVELLGEQRLVELVVAFGFYEMVAMVLALGKVSPPADEELHSHPG